MSQDVVAIKIFSNETDAAMAQEELQGAGVNAFIFKDDAGGHIFSEQEAFVWWSSGRTLSMLTRSFSPWRTRPE